MELKKIAQDADNDFRNENFESAINAYKLILKKIPVNPKVLSNIGNCYFKIGNSDKAIEYLNQAISHSNDPIYKIYLAQVYNKLDNLIGVLDYNLDDTKQDNNFNSFFEWD